MPIRTVLHLDLDAFFCCVEELLNPALKGKAFAVGGSPNSRGVVSSCSYPARAFGVRSAMPMSQAVRLVPNLIIVNVKFGPYKDYSRRVMAIVGELTPMIEQISIDEAFFDVTGIQQPSHEIARNLQQRILDELGLPVSIGVATNKMVAKIATNRGKSTQMNGHTPRAIFVVPPGQEAAILSPLPVSDLWGIGEKTEKHLLQFGIHTIGQLAQQEPAFLRNQFGKHGEAMWHHANGRDTRPVETEQEVKSISSETTFSRDVTKPAVLESTLHELSATVARRLRAKDMQGLTVKLKLRWDDFTTFSRQISLTQPSSDETIIAQNAIGMLYQLWQDRRPIRLIGVGVNNLRESIHQMSLLDVPNKAESHSVKKLVDELQNKFGFSAIRRATDLKGKS